MMERKKGTVPSTAAKRPHANIYIHTNCYHPTTAICLEIQNISKIFSRKI
jgi:hypothetical protein